MRMGVLRNLLVSLILFMHGCQTVLEVHQFPMRPAEFTWRDGSAVNSLVVLADPSCPSLHGQSYEDRVWWQISGELRPPIYYGKLPRGASQQASPRPLSESCGPYTVSVSDQALRVESATFSLRTAKPLPMLGPD